MIKTFKCKETQKLWDGEYSKKVPEHILTRALNRLYRLHTSNCLSDLKVPPSNNLEKLKGSMKQYYSIRINQQYRICFIWTIDNNAEEVEIVDYH